MPKGSSGLAKGSHPRPPLLPPVLLPPHLLRLHRALHTTLQKKVRKKTMRIIAVLHLWARSVIITVHGELHPRVLLKFEFEPSPVTMLKRKENQYWSHCIMTPETSSIDSEQCKLGYPFAFAFISREPFQPVWCFCADLIRTPQHFCLPSSVTLIPMSLLQQKWHNLVRKDTTVSSSPSR